MSKNLTESAAALKWEQSIDLGRGLVTPGTEKIQAEDIERRYALPIDLRGQLVVDFNARDGLFAVACLQRGASAVVAIGVEARPTFEFVRDALGYSPTQLHFKKHEPEEKLAFQGDWVLCFDGLNRSERPMEVIRNAVRTSRKHVVIECSIAEISEDVGNMRWDLEQDKVSGRRWLPTEDAVLDAMVIFGCTAAKRLNLNAQNYVSGRATFLGTK